MPRPRKSRLVPSVSTFAEELVRHIGEHVDRAIAELRDTLMGELGRLRREVERLRAQSVAPPGRRGRPPSRKLCSVAGCGRPHVARGLCKNHYQQQRYAERNR